MASTYTTNSGIEKPGSGEQSGTWGDTVNTNMDIIDTLVSGFVQITAGSTSVTLTTTDGTVSNGMNRVIKYVDGGDLGGNCTVTISPNDQEKLIFVDNGLSASRSLIFSQGSGANFTLQNGKQALIRSDGAGSGAAVSGVLANLELTTLEVTGAAAIDGALTAGSGVAVTGNVTATGTVEPAGDTAAGDDAAIGYTSAEGLILTGQGSTNDITIKNDADSDVITIATGATNVDVVGDLTASTLNADGDTAAGDDAAIGYTSAEGLILTGQGSTNDITIKNDSDADVITIATGTTNVDVVGDLTVATLTADGDTSAGDNATIGYTAAEGLILTGQGSTNDVTIKNDADADVITIATGATNVDVVGDLTAATLNADGDTSAGDNATIGYTAAEGLILTGQGSTSDITVKNDADADVLTVATGTTTVTFKGGVTFTGEGSNTTDAVQGVAKCWANINGSGTPALSDSFNCASLTDNATGDFTVTIANDMGSADYVVGGSANTGAAFTNALVNKSLAAGTVRFVTTNGDSGFDSDNTCVLLLGDLS